jgi:hypothetical protein
VRNGIQCSREHGTVAIAATVRPGHGGWLNDGVVIDVQDWGLRHSTR